MLKKVLSWSIIGIAIVTILPLPLAIFVDSTYHWLLLITLPIGLLTLLILLIWRFLFLKDDRSSSQS
jgi:ABC-type sugar transport system permease subunit